MDIATLAQTSQSMLTTRAVVRALADAVGSAAQAITKVEYLVCPRHHAPQERIAPMEHVTLAPTSRATLITRAVVRAPADAVGSAARDITKVGRYVLMQYAT